jgi:putative phosphoesterase
MIVAVMSDSHNNRAAVREALAIGRRRGADTVIHCGDLGSPDLVSLFRGWSLQLAFGNTDYERASLQAAIRALGNNSLCGHAIRLEADGLRIGAVHGDRAGDLSALTASGTFDFLFHGHTHRRRDSLVGNTRVVNPGALGSVATESRSFCLLDTALRSLEFVELNDACLSPE